MRSQQCFDLAAQCRVTRALLVEECGDLGRLELQRGMENFLDRL